VSLNAKTFTRIWSIFTISLAALNIVVESLSMLSKNAGRSPTSALSKSAFHGSSCQSGVSGFRVGELNRSELI
jgi:hypothetical protein